VSDAERGPWFDVPAGTRPSQCRSCKAVVYWIETAAGRKMPVDVDVPGGYEPRVGEEGHGVSHFSTCPDRDEWRKPK
jgi:hypothetical protein